jgi:hypothetical protein
MLHTTHSVAMAGSYSFSTGPNVVRTVMEEKKRWFASQGGSVRPQVQVQVPARCSGGCQRLKDVIDRMTSPSVKRTIVHIWNKRKRRGDEQLLIGR